MWVGTAPAVAVVGVIRDPDGGAGLLLREDRHGGVGGGVKEVTSPPFLELNLRLLRLRATRSRELIDRRPLGDGKPR